MALTSCSMEKSVQRFSPKNEIRDNHKTAHSGKFKNCSLCNKIHHNNEEQVNKTTDYNFESTSEVNNIVDDIEPNSGINLGASIEMVEIIAPVKFKVSPQTVSKIENVQSSINTYKISNHKNILNVEKAKTDGEAGYSGMAIAGFICGILGVVFVLLTGSPLLMGTLAIIFRAIGLRRTSNGKKGKVLPLQDS